MSTVNEKIDFVGSILFMGLLLIEAWTDARLFVVNDDDDIVDC
jgi:hypothetical protein